MGKNQQHKQQQRSRHAGEGEELLGEGDQSIDVSFHTPEWHAARVAALTAERKTWEEWKLEQKAKEAAAAAVEDEEDRQNREYKAQLAADRAAKLSGGVNQSLSVKGSKIKKPHKSKDKKAHKTEKSSKRHKEDKHSKKKHKSKDKHQRSKHKHASSSSDSSSDDDKPAALPQKAVGPVRLSDFMQEN